MNYSKWIINYSLTNGNKNKIIWHLDTYRVLTLSWPCIFMRNSRRGKNETVGTWSNIVHRNKTYIRARSSFISERARFNLAFAVKQQYFLIEGEEDKRKLPFMQRQWLERKRISIAYANCWYCCSHDIRYWLFVIDDRIYVHLFLFWKLNGIKKKLPHIKSEKSNFMYSI